jgi:hypothetical protein
MREGGQEEGLQSWMMIKSRGEGVERGMIGGKGRDKEGLERE